MFYHVLAVGQRGTPGPGPQDESIGLAATLRSRLFGADFSRQIR
jgi:hypothetical protein